MIVIKESRRGLKRRSNEHDTKSKGLSFIQDLENILYVYTDIVHVLIKVDEHYTCLKIFRYIVFLELNYYITLSSL